MSRSLSRFDHLPLCLYMPLTVPLGPSSRACCRIGVQYPRLAIDQVDLRSVSNSVLDAPF